MKELRKSVNIWRRYGQEFSVLLFFTHGVVLFCNLTVIFVYHHQLHLSISTNVCEDVMSWPAWRAYAFLTTCHSINLPWTNKVISALLFPLTRCRNSTEATKPVDRRAADLTSQARGDTPTLVMTSLPLPVAFSCCSRNYFRLSSTCRPFYPVGDRVLFVKY